MTAELSTGLTCEHRRTTVTVRAQVWVGIDVGKLTHHACAVDETGKVVNQKLQNEQRAIEAVVYVPGRVVNAMTSAFRGEGKTDAKDARVIAHTARMRTDLAEVTMPEDLVVELTQLTGYRTDVMADWVHGINRLRSLLSSIFPALEAAFDYYTRTPLILVAGLCTPAEIRAACTAGVTAHLEADKAWAPGSKRPRPPPWRWQTISFWRCPAKPVPLL
jgi:transposase